MSQHAERAAELREEGCNCAQAVLGAYCEELGLDEDTALSLTAGCGNGLGDTQGTCGAALSGVFVQGLRYGKNRPLIKAKVAAFKHAFREKSGGLNCRELREKKIPCTELVALAAELLEE
jgi:C_GCAxxG_C_C family probable redox protein